MRKTPFILCIALVLSGVSNIWFWNRKSELTKEAHSQKKDSDSVLDEESKPEDPICPPTQVAAKACNCPAAPKTTIAAANPQQKSCKELENQWIQKIVKKLQEACEKSENEKEKHESCTQLGYGYLYGVPGILPTDTQKGLELIENHCTKDCDSLGYAYENGKSFPGITKDLHKALALYEKGCEAKDIGACSSAARLYQGNGDIAANPQKEAEYMLAACQNVGPPPMQGAFEECKWVAQHYLKQTKGGAQ